MDTVFSIIKILYVYKAKKIRLVNKVAIILCIYCLSANKESIVRRKTTDVQHFLTKYNMDLRSLINLLLLFSLNALFMVGGTFSNCVVIASLWKSPQLRKKPGYFAILILSCFDLAVVTINHPVIILTTIFWYMETYSIEIKFTWEVTITLLSGFSMVALLTLNVERYLALTYPFFHQTAVTRQRLVFFMALLVIPIVIFAPLAYFNGRIGNMIVGLFVVLLLIVFIILNYKMFIIARSKLKQNRIVVPDTETTSTTNEAQSKRNRKLHLKSISTCSLTVACFFICTIPQLVYSTLRLTSENLEPGRDEWLHNIWASTWLTLNSTFNCLIFFWRNSMLRREGVKIVKYFRSTNPYSRTS